MNDDELRDVIRRIHGAVRAVGDEDSEPQAVKHLRRRVEELEVKLDEANAACAETERKLDEELAQYTAAMPCGHIGAFAIPDGDDNKPDCMGCIAKRYRLRAEEAERRLKDREKLNPLLLLSAEGKGRVVSTVDLTGLQIDDAGMQHRLFIDQDSHLGFVLLPWDLRSPKDKIREERHYAEQRGENERLREALRKLVSIKDEPLDPMYFSEIVETVYQIAVEGLGDEHVG